MEQFSGNYTGPYWSDGKFQTSVEFGDTDPLTQLDVLSRLHDSAYAKYDDRRHREAADAIYNRDAKALAGMYPSLAGSVVQYGNFAAREGVGSLGPLMIPKMLISGLVYAGKELLGTNLNKEKRDIEEYYRTDPKRPENSRVRTKKEDALSPAQAKELEAAVDTKYRKKSVLSQILSTITPKKNTVVPETPQQHNERLIQAQAVRFGKYNQVYVNSLGKPKKRKRKRMRGHGMGHALDTSLFTV